MTIGLTWRDTGYSKHKVPLFGMECEIEGIKSLGNLTPDNGWTVTEDGSLRNNGREFLSVPSTYREACDRFKNLHTQLTYRADAFSERTSIHVHMNCQPLVESEVQTMIYVYALFEECFFKLVESSRRNNIHCVPLTDTVLPKWYGMSLPQMHAKWSKYTALNIKPLSEYGTIEFRHCQGHNDLTQLQVWLTLLGNLYTFAQRKKKITLADITDFSNVRAWHQELFKHVPGFYAQHSNLPNLTFNPLLDLKLALS